MTALRKLIPCLLILALAGLAGGCSKASREARHVSRADQYFAEAKYPEAEIEYRNAFQLNQENAHVIGRLGLIYHEQGRFSRAYPFLARATQLDPSNIQLRVKMGYAHLHGRNFAEARNHAKFVLEKQPQNTEATLLLAESARTRTAIQEVRQQLQAMQASNATPAVSVALGTLASRAGNRREAETAYRRAIELDPKFAPAHGALGKLYWSQNNLTNADAAFKAAADVSPARSIHRLDYASFKLRTGDLEAGKRLLTEMTKEAPDYLLAWTSLAEVALAEKRFDDSEALIKQALTRDPDNHDTILLQAQLHVGRGHVDRAISELERLVTIYDRSHTARYHLAVAYLGKNDTAKALTLLNEALVLDPNYEDAIVLLAQLNMKKDNVFTAITSLKALLERNPDRTDARLLLAAAYGLQEDYEQALAVYRRLAQSFPNNPQVPFMIGGVLMKQGKVSEAKQSFEKALALAPNYLPALEQLVTFEIEAKQYDAAAARLQPRADASPRSPQLQALLGRVFAAKKDNEAAERQFKKAIAADPDFVPAYLLLGRLYVESGRHDAALAELNTLISKSPRDIPALMLIGMIQSEKKNYAAARDAYEKLIEINPEFTPALNNLAYIYSEKLPDLEKAFQAAKKARELHPFDPFSADTLGWILYKRGEYSWALSLLQESAEKLNSNAEVQLHLGMTYYMLGEDLRARNALLRALALDPKVAGNEEASRRLTILRTQPDDLNKDALARLEARVSEQADDPIAVKRLAAIYELQRAPEKAARLYEQALKQPPKNPALLAALATLNANQLRNPQKALELAKEAHKLAPENPSLLRTLGKVAFDSGDHRWAVTLLEQAAPQSSHSPDALYDMGLAYYSVGRVNDAERCMRNALDLKVPFAQQAAAQRFAELVPLTGVPPSAESIERVIRETNFQAAPDDVPGLMLVGLAAELRGDFRAAAADYERALARYPHFLPALKRLAALNADKLGDDTKAYDLALRAREAFPNDPDLNRVLGTVLYRKSDFRNASRYLSESSRSDSTNAVTLFYLGMSHYKLKQPRESKDALQRASAQTLPRELADEAKRVLAELK